MKIRFPNSSIEIPYNNKSILDLATILIDSKENYLRDTGFFIREWYNNKPYIEVFTSGSTGPPRCILLEKKALIKSAELTGDFLNLRGPHKVFHCLPIQFIAGKMMLVRAMVLGWHIDFVKPTSDPLKHILTFYDFAAMTPMQANQSLYNLNQIKQLIIGGAPVSESLKNKIKQKSTKVFETYGMTETITHIALKEIKGNPSSKYFTCLPTIRVERDSRSCLTIFAPHLSESPIITNDLISLIDHHTFEWLGRYDRVINSGGIKIIPELVERKIENIISQRFFISSTNDDLLGEKLILVVEDSFTDTTVLAKALKEKLSKYEMPKEIYFLNKFEETPTNKVDRTNSLKAIT